MLKLNLLNYKFSSILILLLSYSLIINENGLINNLLFTFLFIFSIVQNYFKYSYKKIYSSIFALVCIYLQLILNDYTFSKEYFLNLILILIFLKFSEIEKKEHYYFFNYTCVFFAVSTLLYGQDLISSFSSFLIIILSIINLYSLNQTKLISLNIRNIFKYLMFALSIIPIIVLVYLIFPRTEINFKLFETKANQLGIPEKISLGSFQDISNSEETVFIYTSNSDDLSKKYYFRVRVFDVLNNSKDWISTNYNFLLKNYSKDIRLNKIVEDKSNSSDLIIFSNEKKWLPKLRNYEFDNKSVRTDIFKNTSENNSIIEKKTPFKIYFSKKDYILSENILERYLQLPNTLSPKLNNWVQKTKSNSLNDKDFLNSILKEFSNGKFYYNLSPQAEGNNYEKFFFESKTGYCEYYAGTFAILSRMGGIPSRIVSGYYGGAYNEIGNFFTFKQQDAHSWVEVYLDGKWERIDPTLSVPENNILNSNNLNFENEDKNTNNTSLTENLNVNKFSIYFDYANYLWTNSFIKYDSEKRSKFLKEKIFNFNFYQIIIRLFTILIICVFVFNLMKFFITKKIFFESFFNKIKKNNNIASNTLTHQDIFALLKPNEKKEYNELFNLYEMIKFGRDSSISLKNFIKINKSIFKYVYLNTKRN